MFISLMYVTIPVRGILVRPLYCNLCISSVTLESYNEPRHHLLLVFYIYI